MCSPSATDMDTHARARAGQRCSPPDVGLDPFAPAPGALAGAGAAAGAASDPAAAAPSAFTAAFSASASCWRCHSDAESWRRYSLSSV